MSICLTTSLSGGHKSMPMCSTNSSVEGHKFSKSSEGGHKFMPICSAKSSAEGHTFVCQCAQLTVQ